jgi:multidrug efflux pump
MNFARFFIDRPIFATVLSVLIVLLGGIAYFTLPVSQYPEIAPPTVVVTAVYPGANPQVIADTVATPIEQEINGVEEMLYMSSQATTDGVMTLTITFRLGTDLDKAQVLVQNRVAIAEPRLPEDVRRLGVTTTKNSPNFLMVVHLLSPKRVYDQLYISNYALLQVRDALRRIDGVGLIQMFGARDYSMRVWLDPGRLSALNLQASDVVNAMREQNVQVAAGTIGQPPLNNGNAFQIPVSTLGRLESPEQFEDIVVRTSKEGRITRLRDVARVELGAQDYAVNSYLDNKPAVALAVLQRPGTNALQAAHQVRETMARLSKDFPDGLEYQIVYDPTVFVEESITAVRHTVLEAVVLVVLVVMLFLQSWRATVIPLIAIPVSLIGTFAVMAALGFSLNSLSLFGLVLAVGIVVDDAIVVVENIERNLHEGLRPREAAFKAMDEVGGAVISVALVLAAVFVPTAFMSGISGQFYRQFALTIAVSTLISAFVSLTLSPAIGAKLLQGHGDKKDWFAKMWDGLLGWLFRGFNALFDRVTSIYVWLVGRLLKVSVAVLIIYVGLLGLTYLGFSKVPTGFIPPQDQGYAIVVVQMPDGASLARTDAVVQKVNEIALGTEGVTNVVSFAGFSGATFANSSNAGALFPCFQPFEERKKNGLTGDIIIGKLRERLAGIGEGLVLVVPPPPVQGLGNAGGFKMLVQDRSGAGIARLQQATDGLVAAANQQADLRAVYTVFRAGTPQFFAEVDRAKAKMLNVPLANVFETLQFYLGSVFVNDFNLFGRTYRVTAQAESRFRDDPDDIAQLKTVNAQGKPVPLGSVVAIKPTTAPDRLVRYNLYPSAEINGDSAPGIGSGQSLALMERLASEKLPRGMSFEWTELAYQQRNAGNAALYIFPLCVLFVFLTLSAQYESWLLPLAVILIVPMCLLAAIGGVWLRGMDNNILTQIGFVVLVGLACKNAILIVEFARQIQETGKDRYTAVIEACRLRLRPILMTSMAFILGVVPLLTAKGAGAEMRSALGTAVFFGMIGVTLFGIFLTPVFYALIMRFATTRQAARAQDDDRNDDRAGAGLAVLPSTPGAALQE